MFVNSFWIGVLVTINVEIILLLVSGIVKSCNQQKKKNEKK